MSIGIWINVVFFLGMGVCALVRPQFVVSFVKLVPETADARNEVRAVYGGFVVAGAVGGSGAFGGLRGCLSQIDQCLSQIAQLATSLCPRPRGLSQAFSHPRLPTRTRRFPTGDYFWGQTKTYELPRIR